MTPINPQVVVTEQLIETCDTVLEHLRELEAYYIISLNCGIYNY